MRVAPECFSCFLQQILKTGRLVGAADKDIFRAIQDFSAAVPRLALDMTPAEAGGIAHRIVREVTGAADPYAGLKRDCIREALVSYPAVKERVAASPDKLLAACQAAIAGNVLDFGVASASATSARIEELMNPDLVINHLSEFKRRLAEARAIVFIADNAGETVFDRILIEEIGRQVTYAVRESPIINDATLEDAVLSGLHDVARIVSSGCSLPGTIPALCSEEFRQTLKAADLIISKGQGNYEGLSDERLPVFFLLKVKCEPVARDLGVSLGGLVLMKSRNFFPARPPRP